MNDKTRKEHDTMGPIEVPADKLWGAQTQRSFENFKVGRERMPLEVIHSLALVKKAAALANHDLKLIDVDMRDLIVYGCDEVLSGKLDDHFPLVVWQTGSGTQTNMNLNEVISNVANLKVGGLVGSKQPIHPNDHVNRSQSSNDVVPAAIVTAICVKVQKELIPNLQVFYNALMAKVKEFDSITKCGRTHLMDAVPLTLGQEFSGFAMQIKNVISDVSDAAAAAAQIPLGGTAVGTGLNADSRFADLVAKKISELTNIQIVSSPNKFEAIGSMDRLVSLSGAFRSVAVAYMKITNDIRLLGSGPRCGIGELRLPSNEPGSSIMPGKVNPTQCEMMTQVAAQVMGNDVTCGIAGSNGHLQLNAFRPVLAYNMIQSIRLLSDGAVNFTKRCLLGIEADKGVIEKHLHNTLMLVTALNQHIGYEKSAKIAKTAHEEGLTLLEAAVSLGFLTKEQFQEMVKPHDMTTPNKKETS